MSKLYDFGLVGLGVMGRNFILNVADHSFAALGLDNDQDKVNSLKAESKGLDVDGTTDVSEFVKKLEKPRRIMLLVPAGKVVDIVIDDLVPLLEPGDLIIDGGNSFFSDTDRREKELKEKGIHFFGTGVSGGAKGARYGPSIMPGGDKEAFENVRPIFEAVSAKVNGEPCVDYMGNGSAGNYVKMVHNGIEYGLMQLIAEIYDLMKGALNNQQIQQTFNNWNSGLLSSFLIEITAEIFARNDEYSDELLVDMILDRAKQKGTGKWTSQNAMDLGIPIPTIDASVSMRELSALKNDRMKLQELFPNTVKKSGSSLSTSDLEKALTFAFVITYAQGLAVLQEASKEYGYEIDLESVCRIWRGGCIIRSTMLENMMQAYRKDSNLKNLVFDDYFAGLLKSCEDAMRKSLLVAIEHGMPTLALSACLGYFDAMRAGKLPLNLVQAQRDHFGSHTYERVDREGIFHTEW